MDLDQPCDPPPTDDDRLPGARIAFCRFASNGDASALEQCFVQCAPHLHRVACRILPGPEHLDLVQECLVVAIQRVADYDRRRPLLPWLVGILNNLARSRHRRRWNRLVSLDSLPAPVAATPVDTGEEAAALRHWRSHAEQGIEQLQPMYRDVVERHLLREQPLVVIARDLGVPSSTVRARLRRGLEQLRRRLPTAGGLTLAAVLAARSANAADGLPLLLRRSTWVGTKSALLAVAGAITFAVLPMLLATPRAQAPETGARDVALTATSTVASADEAADAMPPERVALKAAATPATGSFRVVASMPDGKPASHLPLALHPDLRGNANRIRPQWQVRQTDANGVAEFSNLTPGSYIFRPDDGAARPTRVEVGSGPIEQRLLPPALPLLSVRVEDESGPVADAEVLVGGAGGSRVLGLSAGRTDANGELRVRHGNHRCVWARVSGRATSFPEMIGAYGGTQSIKMIRPLQRCEGSVVDAQNQPIAGATVAVWSPDLPAMPPVFVATDDSGRFSTQDVHAGVWQAFAVAPGVAPGDSGRVASGERATVALRPGGTVRVKMPTGDLPAGLNCLLTGTALRVNPLATLTYPAAAGETLQFDHVPAGEHRIDCYTGAPEVVASASFEIGPAGDVNVELPPVTRVSHEVHVVDEHGNPVVDCFLTAFARLAAPTTVGRQQACRTDRNGRAQFRTPWPQTLVLFAYVSTASGRVPLPVAWNLDAKPGTSRLVLPNHYLDVGRIRARLVGNGPFRLPNGLAIVVSSGIAHLTQLLGAQPAEISNLSPGVYQAMLSASKDEDLLLILCPDIEVTPGGCSELDVDIGRMAVGCIRLEVPHAAARQPLDVHMHHSSGRKVFGARMAPGTSQRLHLAAGDYAVSYLSERGDLASVPFTVATGDDRTLALPRSAGTPCIIRVWNAGAGDPDGPGLTVSRRGGGGGGATGSEGDPQNHVFRSAFDLMPGDYVLTAASTSGRCERAFTVPPDVAEFTLDIELP